MNTDPFSSYASLVPRYMFPATLEAQEAALASNPLMPRLIESRKGYGSDPYRPIYHYVNPEGMLNDPNGLCFWQGRWHLFYQAYPPEDPRQHWGHAVSTDLIHRRDLPYAIYPDPEEKCFSGATLVEDDRVIAIYHGTQVGNMIAVSGDPLLLNWEKLTGRAVIPIRATDGSALPFRVFDPCIWKKGDAYYSLSGSYRPEGQATSRSARTSSSGPKTWCTGNTSTSSPRTTCTRWSATTGRVRTSGRSATATYCCSSAIFPACRAFARG